GRPNFPRVTLAVGIVIRTSPVGRIVLGPHLLVLEQEFRAGHLAEYLGRIGGACCHQRRSSAKRCSVRTRKRTCHHVLPVGWACKPDLSQRAHESCESNPSK